MKTIHYVMGLPRTGSTLLMNLLQQNPNIFTSSTCPTTALLNQIKKTASNCTELIAMDPDVLNISLTNYIKYGMQGWFSALTDKPVVFSKSRKWDEHLNYLFHAYEEPKFIICLRDIRDIICSFEKLSYTYTHWEMSKEFTFHTLPFEKRIELWCTDTNGNLGEPLQKLVHVYDWMKKRPKNFFIFKFENFNQNPHKCFEQIYDWLELPHFNHDLNNIPPAAQYEHDTVYRSLVSHKTKQQFTKLEPNWSKMMTKEQSDAILKYNEWYYKLFYPEINMPY